jgi:phospholipid/cholesterol/gamma-HCH transport system substrate-binding protein
MNKETKIGILAIIAIAFAIWGYKFLRGQNLLSKSNVFYAVYSDVDNLEVSSPVLVNGLQIGTVQRLSLNPRNPKEVIVVMDVRKDLKVPVDAIAQLQTTGFLGGKAIVLNYTTVCIDDCAVSGDTLRGETSGFMKSIFPEETLEQYFSVIRENIGGVIDSVNTRMDGEGNGGNQTIHDAKAIISNLKAITEQINILIAASSNNLIRISSHLEGFSNNLNQNNDRISAITANLQELTEELNNMQLSQLGSKTSDAVGKMNQTLTSLGEASDELKTLLGKMNQTNGTMGKLMNDPDLYNNLDRSVRNLDLLLQDLRLNPKRYVNVSVFGKRQKDYTVPEDDPAFREEVKPLDKGINKDNEN